MKNKYSVFHLAILSIASGVSALGTVPYGFEFAHIFKPYSYLLYILLGVIFALTSALANAILGMYSFLRAQTKGSFLENIGIKILSFLSAIPVGFMCYFGYVDILPMTLNIIFTLTVTLINSAIAYTAIINLGKEIKQWSAKVKNKNEAFCRVVGFFIGAVVSLVAYMSATHGLTTLFDAMEYLNHESAFKLACFIAIITWVPYAALFANSTQVIAGKIYYFIRDLFTKKIHFHGLNVAIVIFSLCSGMAFAQIAIVFFAPDMHIPDLFKTLPMQAFIYHFLVPCTFFASVAVNYLALNNLASELLGNDGILP